MAIDLPSFNPASPADLSAAISGQISGISKKWWTSNAALIQGYLNSLAEAALQTQAAMAAGQITAVQASQIMTMQELALKSTLSFTKFMTLALAQKVFDATFQLVGWAIFNRTGVNLFPGLVKP